MNGEEFLAVVQRLRLSPQQARILELILAGKKDKEIAVSLHLSPHTVRTHLNRLYTRLGISDRMDLVLIVFEDCMRTLRES